MTEPTYQGKRALVIGAAASGLAAARFLVQRGASVTITDTATAEKLGDRIAGLPASVTHAFGGHDAVDPASFNLAVISPGVPWEAPFVETVRAAGVEMISEVELAFRHLTAPVIAVTGSNGKSTTTTLIGDILAAAGLKVFTGGNLGEPLITAVGEAFDWIVAEVSSFQFEGVTTFRPKIGLLLNITPDHLDRHKSMERYVSLKRRVAAKMGAGDTLIVNAADPLTSDLKAPADATTLTFGDPNGAAWVEEGACMAAIGGVTERLFALADLQIVGAHNVENAVAAALAARVAGIDTATVRKGIAVFTGLPHRMEKIVEIDGVAFVNDSKGTNVDATLKSLEGFDRNVVLIAGGSSKGADFAPLAEAIRRHSKGVVLIGVTAREIADALGDFTPTLFADDMSDAVKKGRSLATSGETVLLSPACASFDMFENYVDRGARFAEAARRLAGEEAHAG